MAWQALIPALIGTFLQLWVQTLREGTLPNTQFLLFPGTDGILQVAIYDNENYRPPVHPSQDVKFHLFTQSNKEKDYQIYVDNDAILRSSPYSTSNNVFIVIHGFGQGIRKGTFPRKVRESFMNKYPGSCNLIYVNWEPLATAPLYNTAAANTKDVGIQVAKLVNFLVNYGTTLSKIHLIGFSLGAHVAGFAGKYYKQTYNKMIPRITGLDPALPSFYEFDSTRRLDKTDADFVDVIHTSGKSSTGSLGLAIDNGLGHVDFFVNGGDKQPGCSGPIRDVLTACSHGRSYLYFLESVESSSKFQAVPCDDNPTFLTGACGDCGVPGRRCPPDAIPMGLNCPIKKDKTKTFTYFLTTKSSEPFSNT